MNVENFKMTHKVFLSLIQPSSSRVCRTSSALAGSPSYAASTRGAMPLSTARDNYPLHLVGQTRLTWQWDLPGLQICNIPDSFRSVGGVSNQ